MAGHYNLYYLFLEDQQRNLMNGESKTRILNHIEKYYREMKPPWEAHPPDDIGEEEPEGP